MGRDKYMWALPQCGALGCCLRPSARLGAKRADSADGCGAIVEWSTKPRVADIALRMRSISQVRGPPPVTGGAPATCTHSDWGVRAPCGVANVDPWRLRLAVGVIGGQMRFKA